MRTWFESLSKRDQFALCAPGRSSGAMAICANCFCGTRWPQGALIRWQCALAQQLSRVDLKVEQLTALRAGGGGRQVNLTRTLNQASEANGLAVKRLQPNSRGEVQIRFEGVDFDGVLRFLEQVEGAADLTVLDASISSAGRSGGVNATLRIAGS